MIAGDGVGQEVIPEAKRVLDPERRHGARFEYTDYPWGTEYYFQKRPHVPERAIDQLRPADAIFLGAVGHPKVPDNVTLNGLLLPIRRAFDQYANVRPAVLYPGVQSPLALRKGEDRHGGGAGEHRGRVRAGGRLPVSRAAGRSGDPDLACSRGAAASASSGWLLNWRGSGTRSAVASITKSNAQGFSMVLWDRAFQKVAAEYPDIATESLLVDAAAMNFIRRPESFDVVVASNLFGDILSDISAIIVGSMGLAPSANIDPTRRFPSMFEPVHGSAPDIAGKGIVNPLATIFCAAQMLEHLGLEAAAAGVETGRGGGAGGRQGADSGSGRHQQAREEVTDAVLARFVEDWLRSAAGLGRAA